MGSGNYLKDFFLPKVLCILLTAIYRFFVFTISIYGQCWIVLKASASVPWVRLFSAIMRLIGYTLEGLMLVLVLDYCKVKISSLNSLAVSLQLINSSTTSCAGGCHSMPPPPASLPLTFWPWKWCPSQVWRGLPLCQF